LQGQQSIGPQHVAVLHTYYLALHGAVGLGWKCFAHLKSVICNK